jgi:hypothetical protein
VIDFIVIDFGRMPLNKRGGSLIGLSQHSVMRCHPHKMISSFS